MNSHPGSSERGDRVGGLLNDTQRGHLNQFRQQQVRRHFRQGGGPGGRMGPQAGRGTRGLMRRQPAGTGERIGN